MPALDRRFGRGRDRDHPTIGIGDAGLAQPGERRLEIGQRLGGREGLGDGHDQGRRGIERA